MFFSSKPWFSWNTHKLWKRKTRKTKLKIFKNLQIHCIVFSWNMAAPGAYSGIWPGGGLHFFLFPVGSSAPVGAWKPPEINRFHWPPWIRLWKPSIIDKINSSYIGNGGTETTIYCRCSRRLQQQKDLLQTVERIKFLLKDLRLLQGVHTTKCKWAEQGSQSRQINMM